jgi:peptide-methionine (R)-S-oxide reductase
MQRITFVLIALLVQQCTSPQNSKLNGLTMIDSTENANNPVYSKTDTTPVNMSEEEWKKILPRNVYQVAREKGTERPWSSEYETSKEIGTFYCAVCGNALFKSDAKFESGCGWPSFYEPISEKSVIYETDTSYGMVRKEVMCGRCKSHLGHLFDDGPPPTGLRYCINGVVLDFEKAKEAEKQFNERNPASK